jgi:hypothetical protein
LPGWKFLRAASGKFGLLLGAREGRGCRAGASLHVLPELFERNVAPVGYNQSVPLFNASFAALAVEKKEERTNGAVMQERRAGENPV